MAVFLETFFEAFYTFLKRTTINILLQEFPVVGFELMVTNFGKGADHGRHAGQWFPRDPAHLLRPKYTWTKIPQMGNSGSFLISLKDKGKKIQVKEKVENVLEKKTR